MADLPPVVAQVLNNRGLTSRSAIDGYLNPSPHDPSLLPDMDTARDRLSKAVKAGETIGIFGDFDVDGVTATALMAEGLESLGANVIPYIPHRIDEGHGLNKAAVMILKERGASVLITVDCGVTSIDEVSLAQELGMDVIITDHHMAPPEPPPALSIIDPQLTTSNYPFRFLSGAGLAFKLVQGLHDLLGRPWERDLLELAALSTVADLVPLIDENRFLVKEGLKQLRKTRRPGLQALYRQAGVTPESIDTETIAFVIAPRLNAAGRLEHASASYGLLMAQSSARADELATRLEAINRKRQRLTKEAWATAQGIVESWSPLPAVLMVEADQLSPGIAGLVASRLVDEFYRPAVVMTEVDGMIRASARSIPEFDIGNALEQCGDLFTRHGGHAQAAGFQMAPSNLPFLKERLGGMAEETLRVHDLTPGLDIDAEVPVASLIGETFRWLRDLEPFGVDNPTPTFLTRHLQAVEIRPVGRQGQHLRLKLKEGGVVWDGIAFRKGAEWVSDSPLLDVVYTIGTERRGSTELLALNVLDFRPSAR